MKVSPGCTHCYAERQSHRNPKVLGEWGADGTRVLAAEATWREPLQWDRASDPHRPALVFCASLADVFEEWTGQMTDSQGRPLWREAADDEAALRPFPSYEPEAVPYTLNDARRRLWRLIRATPHLRWQLLTKRPENIARMMPRGAWPNVWLGTTVENQDYAWRIDALRDAPQTVPVRFLSCEPLLGPLSLWGMLDGVQWVIVGGESGSKSREMRLPWVRSLLAQCHDAAVAAFVKQMGRVAIEVLPSGERYPLPLASDHGHGGDWADWPDDVQVRQFPDRPYVRP